MAARLRHTVPAWCAALLLAPHPGVAAADPAVGVTAGRQEPVPSARPPVTNPSDGDADFRRDLATQLSLPRTDEELDQLADSLAQAADGSGQRAAVAVMVSALRDPLAAEVLWRNAARLAVRWPDPALAGPLLDRFESSAATGIDSDLLQALRAAIEATRRRWLELEVDRVAQAGPDAALAALDQHEPRLRLAAWTRLTELSRRVDGLRGELRQRAAHVARARFSARTEGADLAEVARAAALLHSLEPDIVLVKDVAAAFARDGRAAQEALLPVLRGIPLEEGGRAVAEALSLGLRDALEEETSAGAAWVAQLIEALRPVAEAAALDVLESACVGELPESVRAAAAAAFADAGRRAATPAATARVVERLVALLAREQGPELRFALLVGLGQMQDALLVRVAVVESEGGATSGVDAVSQAAIFQALREALPSTLLDRTLAEPCVRALCRARERGADAASVLAEALAAQDLASPIRETLLGGLKELAHVDGLRAVLLALPRGGPTAPADEVGKQAYAALLAVLRSAADAGLALDVELSAVDLALELDRPAWAAWLAQRRLAELDPNGEAEPQHRIRIACARAALAHRVVGNYREAYDECEWVALQEPAGSDRGRTARLLLLELAERIGGELAADADLWGRELRRELIDAGERAALCEQVARVQFAGGDWVACYRWLDLEQDEAAAPHEVLLLKARAAARREDETALRDALRLHELLLGAGGAGGGRLPPDAPQRIGCELALAGLLHAAGRGDEARRLLDRLPAEAELAPELQAERRRVEQRLAGDG
jgi:hypothetical protein